MKMYKCHPSKCNLISHIVVRMYIKITSSPDTKEKAVPVRPARATLPTRCTKSLGLQGKLKLMTLSCNIRFSRAQRFCIRIADHVHLSFKKNELVKCYFGLQSMLHPRSGMSMPLAARSVTRRTLDFLAANLAALIFRAAESESIDSRLVHIHHIMHIVQKMGKDNETKCK